MKLNLIIIAATYTFLAFGTPKVIAKEEEQILELPTFEVTTYDIVTEEYFKDELAHYGLEAIQKNNSIRFLWLRNLEPKMVFEAFDNKEEVELIAKIYNKETKEWEIWKKVSAPRGRHLGILENLEEHYGFFDMPFFDGNHGYDGSDWFIEAMVNGKYHVVYRWSPDYGTKFYELGLMFITSMMESPLYPIF